MYRLAICLANPFEDFNLHSDYGMLEEAYSWACKGIEKGDLDCHMPIAWFYEMAYKYFKIAATMDMKCPQNSSNVKEEISSITIIFRSKRQRRY